MSFNASAAEHSEEHSRERPVKHVEPHNRANNLKGKIKCSLWNVGSINNKVTEVMEYLIDHNADVGFTIETWLKSDKNKVTADIKSYGYTLKHNIRKDPEKDRGGGVGIIVRSTLSVTQLSSKSFTSFEHVAIKLNCTNKKKILLISIYRLLYVPVAVFLEEFPELLEIYTMMNEDFIIAGDINIHVETDESSSVKFHEIIDIFDLKQHVTGPTHIKGHTIDVIITRNDKSVTDVEIFQYNLSHHFLIDFYFKAELAESHTKTITYRNVKKVNNDKFCSDIKQGYAKLPCTTDMKEKILGYTDVMTNVMNKHAPEITKTIRLVPHAPWFDAEYASLRRQRRRAEKKFRKTGSEADEADYKHLRTQTSTLAQEKKKSYVTDKLASDTSSKNLYAIVDNLLDNDKEVLLPTSSSDITLANEFRTYFTEKVNKIRASIRQTSESQCSPSCSGISLLYEFIPATVEELKHIISAYKIKCSPEDPIPSFLLKENIDLFIPYWLDIVNLSLDVGSMDGLKSAVIIPLIKDLGSLVDKEIYKNYRPVSNLLFLGKLIERVVDIRLDNHMTVNKLHDNHQFGYKKYHSTETLLLKIVNNLLLSCDDNMPSVILLLDLSAAFDTVDHTKLLNILYHEIGLRGKAYTWCKSFLTNRTFRIKIGNSYSLVELLLFGVAQGSVLGPRFFNIYTRPLYRYLEPTKFDVDGFADDNQLVKRFLPAMQSYALGESIQSCLTSIFQWMNEYFLRLNPDKTKILVIAPPSVKKDILISGIFLNGTCIRFVDSAKDLGVIIDTELAFDNQINKIVKSCFMMIRKLSSIKQFLSMMQLKSLVFTNIFSQLDYCNLLYYGLNSSSLMKLQRVQNAAARLIRSKESISLNDVFTKCHWLRVRERILFKLLLTVHKCINNKAPDSVCALLEYGESDRTKKLQERKSKSKYGDRAFSHAGPKVWNHLPMNIRIQEDTEKFKKMIKTHLMLHGHQLIQNLNTH